MINLIGCSKENFLKLLSMMEYKYEKLQETGEEYFSYAPKNLKKSKQKISYKLRKNTPFAILSNLSLK